MKSVIRKEQTHTEKYDICPHCNKEIGEKELFFDQYGKYGHLPETWVHRSCDGEIEFPKDPEAENWIKNFFGNNDTERYDQGIVQVEPYLSSLKGNNMKKANILNQLVKFADMLDEKQIQGVKEIDSVITIMAKEITEKEKEELEEKKIIEDARKKLKSSLFDKLIKLADTLDQKGFNAEAAAIDQYLDGFCPDCQKGK